MKLNNAIYATNEQREELLKELNIHFSIINLCSMLIIRKNKHNYIIKDRWYDPFRSVEENLEVIKKYNFMIISKTFFKRIQAFIDKHSFIQSGDKLIIEM